MDNNVKRFREKAMNTIELLANPAAQLEYEQNVPKVYVPYELMCNYEALYRPETELFGNSFSAEELVLLARLNELLDIAYDSLPGRKKYSSTEVDKWKEWQAVMFFAKEVLDQMKGESPVRSGPAS